MIKEAPKTSKKKKIFGLLFMCPHMLYSQIFSRLAVGMVLTLEMSSLRAATQTEDNLGNVPSSTVCFFLQKLDFKKSDELERALHLNKMYERDKVRKALTENKKLFSFLSQANRGTDIKLAKRALRCSPANMIEYLKAHVLRYSDRDSEHYKELSVVMSRGNKEGLKRYITMMIEYYEVKQSYWDKSPEGIARHLFSNKSSIKALNVKTFNALDEDLEQLRSYWLNQIIDMDKKDEREQEERAADHTQLQTLPNEINRLGCLSLSQEARIGRLETLLERTVHENQHLKVLLTQQGEALKALEEENKRFKSLVESPTGEYGLLPHRRYGESRSRSSSSLSLMSEGDHRDHGIDTGSSGYRSENRTPVPFDEENA